MFRKLFTFSNATLLVALALSTIAAWYSIVGLTAIFAGAVVPIIIMGTALEFGKVVTTVWLRKYWHRCAFIMKLYLVPAVFFLAVLTSMGIFGFLSKAHMDQGIVSGDAVAKVSLYDEKIAIQKDVVKSSKAMLAQMDMQVNDIMTKGDSEKSVERSVAIRKQQAKERASLQKDIENANKEIQRLNEERAPLAAETRKIEAEVGPIKYIAALIYGDNPDQNVLERSVRWVIILLVAVFDPLALMLVIAANQSKEWDENDDVEVENKLREEVKHEQVMAEIQEEAPVNQEVLSELQERAKEEDLTEINHQLAEAAVVPEPDIEIPEKDERTTFEKHPYLLKPFTHFEGMKPMVSQVRDFENTEVKEEVVEDKQSVELKPHEPEPQILAMGVDVVERPGDYVTPPEETGPSFEGVKVNGEWVQTGPAFPEQVLPEKIDDEYVMYNGKPMHLHALKGADPDLFGLVTDSLPNVSSGFGVKFPEEAKLGDVFVRTDTIPHRTFKYNGTSWIEAPQTTAHLGNTNYLQHLIQKISTGEYDPELLTEDQQDAVTAHIKSGKV